MSVTLGPWVIGVIGICMAIAGHAGATIWFASSVNSSLKYIKDDLDKITQRIDKADGKVEIELKALWTRVDDTRERLVRIESKEVA